MYRFLIFLMLLPSIIFADEPFVSSESDILDSVYTPLTTLHGVPETNIFGVNVINGDYNYSSVDFDLPGADPLILLRTYSSSNLQFRAFYDGWTHNLSGLARAHNSTQHVHLTISGSLSGELPFRNSKGEKNKFKINREIFKKGVTNCGQGEISGRNNIKNMEIIRRGTDFDIKHPDGTEHSYYEVPNDSYNNNCHTLNHLEKTKKPNGLITRYDTYGYFLNSVKALNDQNNVSNAITFTGQLNSPEFKKIKKSMEGAEESSLSVRNLRSILEEMHRKSPLIIEGISNDGKTSKYFFQTDRKYDLTILMSKFESNHLPTEFYTYTPSHYDKKLKSHHGERHKTTIDYYEKGDAVYSYGYGSKTVSSDHIALNRVKKINIAVDDQHDLQTIYHFAYYNKKDSNKAFTDVYNQYNHLSRFHYSTKNYNLNCVERFTGTLSYTLLCRERLCFGEKDTNREGDLLFKTVEKPDGTIHYGEYFRYDEHGNVLKQQLHFRTFTDLLVDNPIKENPGNNQYHPKLEGGEIKFINSTYNNSNLPTSVDNGKLKTLLNYHIRNGKESPLLKSKFFQEDQTIKRREFYEFDKNTGCTLKIIDDGSGNELEDLQNLHIRKITRYINREESFAGLPLEIDEWGSIGKSEHRISRTVLTYDSHGYVESQSHYDSHNQLAYTTQQIRDIQGNITSETNPLGHTTLRKYNRYRSLLEEHGPSPDYFMKYTYDWLQRPVTETRRCSDGINLTIVKSYDLEGKITKIQDPYGATTEFTYNELGRPIKIIHPPIRTDRGKWIRPREVKKYNFMGHLTSETDPKGAVTSYIPNDAGLPLKITYPDGTVEQFRYSIYGEVLEKKQRNDSKVIYTYDAFSRPTSEKIYDRDGKLLKESHKTYSGHLLLSETDGEGLTTSYQYNYAGKISEIHRGSALTKYVYDRLGRVSEEQRYFGKNSKDYIAKVFTYDLLNRVTGEQEVDASGTIHSKSKTTYDFDGNITSTKTWNHGGTAVSINTYDPRGNLTSSTDPLGNTTHYNYRYDFIFEGVNVPCLEITDPTGVKTITVSDHQGAVISMQVYSPVGTLLSDEEMFYDICGNLVRKEHHLPKETLITLLDYDSSSRLIRQVNGAGTPEQIVTTFVYNSFGELSKTQYNDSTSKNRTYDGLGRLSEEWSNDKTIHYHYTYNRQDLPTVVKNRNIRKKTTREYSLEGNLLSEQFENGLKISYRHDRMNRVTECIYPDGSSVKQTYNPIFLTKAERIKNDAVVYDASFQQFDLTGKPKQIIFPRNSGTLSLKYDLLNRPKRLSSRNYDEKEICYDTRGLLTSKIVNGDLQKFEHDHLQQIILEQTSLYSHTYENDALHRQTSVDGHTQTHNAVHQLTKGVHATYEFDTKGRRKQDGNKKFTYDKFDRLIKIRKGGSSWDYIYDAFNRKMSRTFSGKTVYYLYDGHEEIGAYDSDLKNIDLKVLSDGEGSIPIAIELGNQHYAPLISSQGHIVGLTEIETGNLADKSDLTMFGEDLAQSPLSPWRFCGKRHESSELGLIDFGFRFYHPKSAQWLTQDPIGDADGPNLYAYVGNSPTCCLDRFGLYTDNIFDNSILTNMNNGWGQTNNFLADHTINSPRFHGAARALGGFSEYTAGFSLATGGSAASGGLLAPVAVPAGCLMMAHGGDNFTAGCKQFITGQRHNPLTVQLLEKGGMSNGAASITNDALCFGSAAVSTMVGKGAVGVGEVTTSVGRAQAATSSGSKIPQRLPHLEQLPQKSALLESHIWQNVSPFKNKTAYELHEMFLKKGFRPAGKDPINGYGNYINPKNGRQYHIDPKEVGRYREPNHVDVSRLKNYSNELKKKRFGYSDE